MIVSFTSRSALAQSDDFQIANRLIQQQNYDEALPVIENLYNENPRSILFFEQYMLCLINLRMYDVAESVARDQINNERYRIQAVMKLAEVMHIKGDRDEALKIWQKEIDDNGFNIQTYYTVGASMINRQEFDAAIDVYRKGRDLFDSNQLFTNELADTYMQAGRFEESVNEYFKIILDSPDQMGLVQQRFFNMRDPELYEIAAFELEDLLMELHFTDGAYSPLYQLLAWLLLETEEYRRAFLFARHYENQTSFTIYSLFSLANRFVSAREFDLAVEAYEYYLDDGNESMRTRAMEELAYTYIQWAQHLQQHNLDTQVRLLELYQKAYDLNSEILENYPNYNRSGRVYTRIIDLSVDYFKDLERAEYWFNKMSEQKDRLDDSYLYYAEGRVALFYREFTTARQSLTRAHRSTDDSNLSEQSRYYLSLSDFFAGDYDFAELQLQSLERRTTSYYANDAIKLRMWIKNGQRADSTHSLLNSISDAIFNLHTGNFNVSLNTLEPILANSRNPFAADMITELIAVLPIEYNELLLELSERIIQAQPQSSKKERLMWDRVTLIEKSLTYGQPKLITPISFEFLDTIPSHNYSEENLIDLYEDILMEFPNGFYASTIREKLQNLDQNRTQL